MIRDLRPVLAPRSIAIVGASERSAIVRTTIENCETIGYAGALFAVHPQRAAVLGLPCYPSLAALPETPDCALIALNAERAVAVVEEACALGIPSVVLPAGGFAERGGAGNERQQRIVQAARTYNTQIIGPNCMGVLSPPDRAAVYIGTIARPLIPSNVSGVAQSGSVVELLVNTAQLDFARLFSSGNEAVLTTCDYLEYLLDDVQTEVILLYLEAYREPQRLLGLAERALALGKPVIAIALGRSAPAQALAQAHSGALATSHRRLTAALLQRGVLLCEDLDEWIATAQLAATGRFPRGNALGAVTVSGGEAGLLLDLAETCGVQFPSLSEPARRRLSERFPDFDQWSNPADGWDKGPYEEVYPPLLAILADEPLVDVLVAAIDVPAVQGAHEVDYTSFIGQALGEQAMRVDKPAVYLSPSGGALDQRVRRVLTARGTPLLGGAQAGLRAVAHLAAYAAARKHRDRLETAPADLTDAMLRRLVAGLPFGPADEQQSRHVLQAAALPLLSAEEVRDEAGALAAAAGLSGPVVLKAVLPGVAHKSEAGAVALRLSTPDQVSRSATRLLALCDQAGVPRRLLVSPYLEPVLELICGIICDPDWGAFVALGLGGILVEALDEVQIVAAPFHPGQAATLVRSSRIGRVLTSPRRPVDVPALTSLVEQLGWLAPRLWSLDPSMTVDLNPVMLMPLGQGAWIADALITRHPPTTSILQGEV